MGVILIQEEKLSSHHSSSSQLQSVPNWPMISVCNSRGTVFDNLFQSFPGLKSVSWRIPVLLLHLMNPCVLVGTEVIRC